MSELTSAFEAAAAQAKDLPSKPDNETLLKLYAFYKQATAGDVQGKRPGFTDFTGRAKYDAWSEVQGLPAEQAMQKYIDLVNRLKG
jgi:acyl-CoA-binding protein